MHIPENYLSPSTCGVMGLVMLPIWATAAKRATEQVPREKMPLLGVAAAFCFLAMMFNVPMPGGTTGHAVCGTLVAVLFGPWAAVLAVSVALAIQAVFFGDGGVLALGANCFNMAFVLPMVGYWLYGLMSRRASSPRGRLVAAGVASYVAINVSALCAGIEFGIQPLLFTDAAGQALYCPYPLSVSIPAMLIGHLTVWGGVEAIFTMGILAFLRKVAPSFGAVSAASEASSRSVSGPVVGLIVLLVVATPLGLLAEGDAWGEWGLADLAQAIGYAPAGMANGWEWASLAPDYSLGGLPDWAGYILSAIIGVCLLIVVFRLVASLARPSVDFGKGRASAPHPAVGSEAGPSDDADALEERGSGTRVEGIPAWLQRSEGYVPPRDKRAFVGRSMLGITSALQQFRMDDGGSGKPLPFGAPALLLFGLGCILLTSLSSNFAFTLIVLAVVLVRLCLVPDRVVRRVTGVACAAAAMSFLVMLPAILLGQSTSAVLIGSKVLVSVSIAMLVTLAMPYNRFTAALRAFKLPDMFIMVFDMALKNIVSLGRMALELLDALRCRSVGRNASKGDSLGGVAGVLFLKSQQASQDTYEAMQCRGFNGSYAGGRGRLWHMADLALLAVLALLIVLFVYLQGLV